jgi:hypothetical protein
MQGKEKLFHHSLNDDKAYKTVDWRDHGSSDREGIALDSRLMENK